MSFKSHNVDGKIIENMFGKMLSEQFPDFIKIISPQNQEAKQTISRIHTHMHAHVFTPKCIKIKLLRTNDKDERLKQL